MTRQLFEDNDTVTYLYDNDGILSTVIDSASGIKTKYYYDFAGRLVKYTKTNTQRLGSGRSRAFLSSQLPINPDHIARAGLVRHMSNLNAFNHSIQNPGSQFLYIGVLAKGRAHFSAFHTFGKALDLLEYIRVEHLVINAVCFRANLRVVKVIHAQINVRCPVKKLLLGNDQRMTTAIAEELPAE